MKIKCNKCQRIFPTMKLDICPACDSKEFTRVKSPWKKKAKK